MATKLVDDNYVMVAAIDFGTTFSGYAFSFKNDMNKIYMNKSWGESVGFQSYKTPTCVMVDSSNSLLAFGYDAERMFSELEEEDCGGDYHLYRHFKMMLHDSKRITKSNTIHSIDGKVTFALEIFAMALNYLKDHLIEVVSQQTIGVSAALIRWVITVPAIWGEEAKQFMREAALQAGIIQSKDSRQLIIALEPEAASIYCRSLDVKQFSGSSGGESSPSFKQGTKYMVIDAGGGTIDLTAHEVLDSGKVKEIHTVTGGAWGGTKVDQNFIILLEDVLSKNFIVAFQQQCPQQWLLFMVNFERVKRSAKPDGKSKIAIPVPFVMATKYQEICGNSLDTIIKQAQKPGLSFANGLLILKFDAVISLYQSVTENIVCHIEKLLEEPVMSGCSYFMLVGGFADSKFLQKAINDKFRSRVNVLVPEEAQLSVIKGAVLFGHRPDDIEIRKARKCYGIGATQKFNPAIHDEEHKFFVEEEARCGNLFSLFVKKGDDVRVGETIDRKYHPTYNNQTDMDIDLYQSDSPNVKYVVEEGCKHLGQLEVEMPNVEKDMDRKVEVKMTFGGTEIQIEALDVESGCTTETAIDFLCD